MDRQRRKYRKSDPDVQRIHRKIHRKTPGKAQILVYSDEGFSGKDTNRPEFQKMLEDMKQRPFQYLVCYRLDRLGRNLADLAWLIEN